jgi:hypothetical protein
MPSSSAGSRSSQGRAALPEEGADAAAVDAAQHLAGPEAEGVHVIAKPRSRLPPRLLRRQCLDHRLPAQQVCARRQRTANGGQAGLVTEQVANRQAALSRRGKLGPVLGDRRIEIHQPAIDEPQQANRRDRLAERPHIDDRIASPGALPPLVQPAAPEIDDEHAAHRHGNRRADVASLNEVALELRPDACEAAVAVSVNHLVIHQRSPITQV